MEPEVTAVAVKSTVAGEHTAAGLVIITFGNGFSITIAPKDGADVHPLEGSLAVKVYVPAAVAYRFMPTEISVPSRYH